MVYTEINLILDCGEKKSTPEIYMTKVGLELYYKYKQEEAEMESVGFRYEQNKTKYEEWQRRVADYHNSYEYKDDPIYPEIRNQSTYLKGLPAKPKLTGITEVEYEKYKNWNWFGGERYNSSMDAMLFRYYDIKPFEPWVMLNVSPDRAGTKITRADICKFKRAFNSYMKEEWFSEWYITFETGGNGDHLHLHAVCKMGSDNKLVKSVRTHIGKGNWKRQFMKHCKAEGFEGIKNQGCQAIIINREELLEDKLNYLIEEKKPIGHKNKTPNALKDVTAINKRGRGSLIDLLSS